MARIQNIKAGDYVYYHQKPPGANYSNTIPCIVDKVNRKTLVLNDGFRKYRNVSPSNVELQSEHPTYIGK